MSTIIARLKEPSSMAGIAGLLGLFGVNVAPETWTAIIGVITAVASLAAILIPEKK